MVPPQLLDQIYQDECTQPKCGELSEYIHSAHTEVEDSFSRYI